MKKAKGKIKFCAQSLQAKFALRRMYMSGDDLSQQQLEFVVDFLERETVIHRLSWWKRLTHTERLALVKDIKLKYLYKGETLDIRTTDLKQSYVILRGHAEGFILDRPNQVPVHMRDGSVFGNLHFVNTAHSSTHNHHVGWVGEPQTPSRSKFQKVVLRGPVDCLVLSADSMERSVNALNHVTTNNCLELFGMEMLEPYVRYRTFDAGSSIVRQGDPKSKFYIIVKGTAKATFKDDSVEAPPPIISTLHPPGSEAPTQPPKKLEVALLGPQSYVGDISSMFNVLEPVTVKCTTSVDVVYFQLEELFDALKTYDTIHKRIQWVAYRTLEFLIERLQQLFGVAWTNESKTFDELSTFLMNYHLPSLPLLEEPSEATPEDKEEHQSPAKHGSPATKSPKRSSPGAKREKHKHIPHVQENLFQYVHVDTRHMAPVEPTKEIILALHSMHSSFRQTIAPRDLSQHIPSTAPPVDDLNYSPHLLADKRPLPEVIAPPKGKSKRTSKQHFLFPTMTKQRQYHGRSLPLLQRCHGIETPWCPASSP